MDTSTPVTARQLLTDLVIEVIEVVSLDGAEVEVIGRTDKVVGVTGAKANGTTTIKIVNKIVAFKIGAILARVVSVEIQETMVIDTKELKSSRDTWIEVLEEVEVEGEEEIILPIA